MSLRLERWACFALGTLTLSFANGATASILAAWIAPLLLLRFVSLTRPLAGYVLMALAVTIASLVTLRGVIPVPTAEFVVTCIISGGLGALPYLLHRMLAPRLRAVPASLVFPTASVALLYALSISSPFGTWGVDGYVQTGFEPLAQFASVAGVWGVTFLVFWFASSAQGLFNPTTASSRAAFCVFAASFVLVLGFGMIRMADSPEPSHEIEVAALSGPTGLPDKFFEGCDSREDIVCRRNGATRRIDALFAAASQATLRGARVIVWPEAAAQYDQAMEPEFISRASAFARAHAVYLIAGVASVPADPNAMLANKAMVFDPLGNLAFEYHKAIPVPGEPIAAGDGRIHSIDTPFGRLGVIICFDADFPILVQQAKRQGIDILAIPANDWPAIKSLHAHMARFRAIENGFSVVRATSNGVSLITDSTGNALGQADSFTAPGGSATALLPVAPRWTVYSEMGDAFAWACLLLLAVLVALVLMRRRRSARQA